MFIYFFSFLLLIFSFNACSFSAMNYSRQKIVYETNDLKINNFYFRYYRAYVYEGNKYLFKKENEIQPDNLLGLAYYYKVYFDNDSDLIVRVECFSYNLLSQTLFYDYDDKGVLEFSRQYLAFDKSLFIRGFYKDGILYARNHYDRRGEILYKTKVSHLDDKGIKEGFYDNFAKLSYIIFYNDIRMPVRIVSYKNNNTYRVDFHYDADGFLRRKAYYENGFSSSYLIYKYDEKAYRVSVQKYVDRKLVSNTRFDLKGRETQIENYRNNRLSSYSRVTYDSGVKVILSYNQFDQIINRKEFNLAGQILSDKFYDNKSNLVKEIYNTYNNFFKIFNKVYVNGKINLETFYNDFGFPVKIKNYNEKGVFSFLIERSYNKDRLLEKQVYRGRDGRIISQLRFFYDNQRRIIAEDVFIKKKLDYKKVYSYGIRDNRVVVIKYFRFGKLFKKEFLDKKGRVRKAEYGSTGRKIKSEFYKYSKDGKLLGIRKFDPYDNIDESVRIRYFKDKTTSLNVMQEDNYNRRNQYVGSVVSYFDVSDKLFRKEVFNYLQQKTQTIYYNANSGKEISREKHEVS